MRPTLTLLNTGNITTAPTDAGVYLLKHQPTGRVFFGSTVDLRERLRQWFYQIERSTQKSSDLPMLVRITLHGGRTSHWELHSGYGAKTYDWFYSILAVGVPAGYKPQRAVQFKPEWTYIQAWNAKHPELLLNDIMPTARQKQALQQRGNKGISPKRYLKGRLGLGNNRYTAGQPAHNHPVDTHKLPTIVGSTAVPFANYLQRSMDATQHRANNPSAAAIQELFRHWLKYVPDHEPVHRTPAPGTINDALAVPVPKGYQV